MVNLSRMILRGTILLGLLLFIWPQDLHAQISITTTSPLPDGVVGTPYSVTLMAVGGVGQRTWSVDSGSLPAGLTLSASQGVISGTPTTAATSNFRIRVVAGTANERNFTLKINTPVTITTASPLPNATQGANYSQTLTASGGTTPYAWSIVSGSLPAGLTRSGATISGNPTSTGNSTFTVRVTDSSVPPQQVQKDLT
ncbi:MAG TPA: Ig domain-containing protein, partial [Terriglobia bacterium]|nr:Ig domain-containing protein [Terriglobia bacterium]